MALLELWNMVHSKCTKARTHILRGSIGARVLRTACVQDHHGKVRASRFLQRYFSYRAILVAIVLQNSFVLVFYGVSRNFKKILVSVKFVSAILGPEMGAPILWTPGKCVLSAGKTMSVKFPFFGGGFWGGGGGSADFIFMGARIFLTIIARCVAKWGIAQMFLCETKCQGGGIAPCWGRASLP